MHVCPPTDRRLDDRGGDSAYLLGSRPEADLEMMPGMIQLSPPSSSSSWETVTPPAGTASTWGGGGGLISSKISISYFLQNINFRLFGRRKDDNGRYTDKHGLVYGKNSLLIWRSYSDWTTPPVQSPRGNNHPHATLRTTSPSSSLKRGSGLMTQYCLISKNSTVI